MSKRRSYHVDRHQRASLNNNNVQQLQRQQNEVLRLPWNGMIKSVRGSGWVSRPCHSVSKRERSGCCTAYALLCRWWPVMN